jgi:hypothetical protein
MQPQPDSGSDSEEIDREWKAEAKTLTETWVRGQIKHARAVRVQGQSVPAWGEARELSMVLVVVLAKAQAQAESEARAPARALARALAVALAVALEGAVAAAGDWARARTGEPAQALERAKALAGEWAKARTGQTPEPTVYAFRYDEVLVDSKLKEIIYSMRHRHRLLLPHHLWRPSHTLQEHWWLIQILVPITRLPPELLQQILLIAIDRASTSPLALMLVCKYWYNIITDIWASLELGTRTPKDAVTSKLERNQCFLDISVDTEIDRGHFNPSEGAYGAIFAAIEASSRWRSFIVETLPAQADLPEHLVNHGLQRCSDTVMSRLRTFKIKCPCEMSPLLDGLLRILGTSASGELTTVEINSANVISFLAPTYPSMFHSVKVLHLNVPGLSNPVDILPHLPHLETLTASHLLLPIYHDDVNLPFVLTLRRLSLRAASIQWMSGRTFHALESCTLIFPLHRHVLHAFHTTLPNCTDLTFEGYPLDILDGVSAHKLTHLSVVCPFSYKPLGNRQLGRFSSRMLRESGLTPLILRISIEATNEAWTKALASMSNLEELVIDNAQPSSLGVKVLQSLIHPVNANNPGTTATPGGRDTPLCPSLKRFGLRYRRWLRPSEHFDLIPEFMSIIRSREQSNFPLQSFRIWTRSDHEGPLELITGPWISFDAFVRLANDSGITQENLLQWWYGRSVEHV